MTISSPVTNAAEEVLRRQILEPLPLTAPTAVPFSQANRSGHPEPLKLAAVVANVA